MMKKVGYKKRCLVCGVSFESERAHSKFCSSSCRSTNHRIEKNGFVVLDTYHYGDEEIEYRLKIYQFETPQDYLIVEKKEVTYSTGKQTGVVYVKQDKLNYYKQRAVENRKTIPFPEGCVSGFLTIPPIEDKLKRAIEINKNLIGNLGNAGEQPNKQRS